MEIADVRIIAQPDAMDMLICIRTGMNSTNEWSTNNDQHAYQHRSRGTESTRLITLGKQKVTKGE